VSVPILRTSERRDFKRCQRKWQWAWREGFKPVTAESTPLWFGTGVHLALAEWYLPGTKRGVPPAETFEKFAAEAMRSVKVKDATEERVAEYEDGAALGVKLMELYVVEYGQDASWDFIQAEQTFSLPVPWPDNTRQTAYVVDKDSGLLVEYKGTYDGVYRDLVDGRIKLLETKTAKAIQTAHLAIDDQAGSYWAVATATLRKMGKIGPKESISEINYNFIRKALPDERPKDAQGYATNKPLKADYVKALLEVTPGWMEAEEKALLKKTIPALAEMARVHRIEVLGERSKVQPSAIFERHPVHRTSAERSTQLRLIQSEAVQMQLVRDGVVEDTKNPTRDCQWDCSYYGMCELRDRQGDWRELARVSMRRQDPYADHRKSAEE
jgi:PD-(D/E)XK nuclease superfamily